MKQEPTGAAHAAGGIPALQGREDVNAGTTYLWDESWTRRFTIAGVGVEDRGLRRLTLSANLPPAQWIIDGQPFVNVTMEDPDGTRWYGAMTDYALSSVELAGLPGPARVSMLTVTFKPSRVMIVGGKVQNIAPAGIPFEQLELTGKGLQ